MKNETLPISLGCLLKPVDDLFKLFDAAGLLCEGLGLDF